MPHPVKLAYVTTMPVTQWGFLRGQNPFFAARGFEIHAIASPGKLFRELAERDGVAMHPVPIARTVSPLHDLVSVWRLFRLFRRLRPDIAHVSTPKAALVGAIAAWAARVPVRVFCLRGSATESASGVRRLMFRLAERLTASLCHEVICVSASLLEFARSESIVPPSKGVVAAHGMSNGIDVDRFSPAAVDAAAMAGVPASLRRAAADPNIVVIGYVGRIARDKGIEVLCEAWRRIRNDYPNARLVLAGPWEREEAVPDECRRAFESDPHVHVVGDLIDVIPYYRVMSFCVFPSFGSEGFPNAPMEAASMGLPVVATRVVGSIDAVEHEVTGLLVPSRDPGALAAAMRAYLDDADLRRRHGMAGARRVRLEFRQERIWKALYREYARLLRRAGLDVDDPGRRLDPVAFGGTLAHEEHAP